MAQKSIRRPLDDEVNYSITNPKPSFILCYDEIKDNFIESAKKNNLGILLVHTKKYDAKKADNAIGLFDHEVNNNSEHKYLSYLPELEQNVSEREGRTR